MISEDLPAIFTDPVRRVVLSLGPIAFVVTMVFERFVAAASVGCSLQTAEFIFTEVGLLLIKEFFFFIPVDSLTGEGVGPSPMVEAGRFLTSHLAGRCNFTDRLSSFRFDFWSRGLHNFLDVDWHFLNDFFLDNLGRANADHWTGWRGDFNNGLNHGRSVAGK